MTTAFHAHHTQPSPENLDELMHWIVDHVLREIHELRADQKELKGDLKEGVAGIQHRLDWQREWIKEQQSRKKEAPQRELDW